MSAVDVILGWVVVPVGTSDLTGALYASGSIVIVTTRERAEYMIERYIPEAKREQYHPVLVEVRLREA